MSMVTEHRVGEDASKSVAVVLAGGGARGAYEVGVLSVLLPALARRGERVDVFVGTSVGALNVAWLAANMHRDVDELVALAIELWQDIRFDWVLGRIASARNVAELLPYGVQLFGVRRAKITGLLDSSPLRKTVPELIDFAQLEDNVERKVIRAAAVIATSALTGRSVVFEHGVSAPPVDNVRRIDYVAGSIQPEHVLASAAIPTLFPAVEVYHPPVAAGWYFDGGTRLNTPIKPALALGAEKVIVVGLNSTAGAPSQLAGKAEPDVFQGAGQILQALLADPLTHDIRTLATINHLVAQTGTPDNASHKIVPYVFVAPRTRGHIGAIARRVFREHYRPSLRRLAAREAALLGWLMCSGSSPEHADLLSYVFFAPEFAEELVRAGRNDAHAWLDTPHDDGPWQHGPLAPARRPKSSA
jgi:NTE family protein